jgi:hypothetical protein
MTKRIKHFTTSINCVDEILIVSPRFQETERCTESILTNYIECKEIGCKKG